MRNKAFTLIELLVVISIVALLASVVLAALNTARDKGRVGGATYFSSQIAHVAGDQAVGIWDFDECSGTTAYDRSGYSNTGSLLSGASFSSDTPTGKGCSVAMTASNQYVNLGTGSALSNISTEVTVMGWIKITTVGCYNWIFSNDIDVSTGYNGIGLGAYCGSQSVFRLWNSTRTSLAGPSIPSNQWTHMAGVYDGTTMKLYLDGKIAASVAYSSGIGTPASFTNTVGNLGNCPTCAPHGMYADNVAVYSKALTGNEIGEIYAREKGIKEFASK